MAIDPKKLIAAINPDLFCSPESASEVKKVLSETKNYIKAAEKAELKECDYVDVVHTWFSESALSKQGLRNPIERHKVSHDAFSQSLEPLYFWFLDYISAEYGSSEKLTDNFITSAGSGMHSEFGQKATKMQEEAMKMLATTNTVLRTVLNLVYDLKEFKIRLDQYKDLKSDDSKVVNAALLSLKQIWMDSVDIKRGTGSLRALSQNYEYVTLIDAFMVSDSLESAEKLDLNDRVKRIIQQRLADFFSWLKNSEEELTKRYQIERNYLKSQVNAIKLYSRWIKPYLKAAKRLEQKDSLENSSLVNLFNTAIFELNVLGKGKYGIEGDIQSGEIPPYFANLGLRKYHPIVLLELRFRSVPERTDQRGGYGFRGRVEVEFTSFALNDEELKLFKKYLEKDDLEDVYKVIENATDESIGLIKKDIDEFLEDKPKEEKKPEKKEEDLNPFTALFSFFKESSPKKIEEKSKDSEEIKKDSPEEQVVRSQALLLARFNCRKFYDSFKRSIQLPSFPPVQE